MNAGEWGNIISNVILRTGAVVEIARAQRLQSISEGVTRLTHAGRKTCKVRRDFKIITNELSRVSRQFHWWHRTFGDLQFVLQNLYIRKQVTRFWRVECSFQNRRVKGSEAPIRPTLSATTNLSGVYQQPALTHTAVTTKRKGEEERY